MVTQQEMSRKSWKTLWVQPIPLQASIELHPTSEMCSPCSQTSVNHLANRIEPNPADRRSHWRQAAAVVAWCPLQRPRAGPPVGRYPWDPNFCLKTETWSFMELLKSHRNVPNSGPSIYTAPVNTKIMTKHDKTTKIVISTQWHHPGVARPLAASCCLTTARRVAGGSIGQHHLPWQCWHVHYSHYRIDMSKLKNILCAFLRLVILSEVYGKEHR